MQEISWSLWYLYFIMNKKVEAINLRQKYFHYYDTYTLLIFHENQKVTSNKFVRKILSFLWCLYFIINKRNKRYICARKIFIPMIPILFLYFIKSKKGQAINLRQKYFHPYDTYTSLWTKRTSNKFAPEIFSLLWYLYFTYISSKPKSNK